MKMKYNAGAFVQADEKAAALVLEAWGESGKSGKLEGPSRIEILPNGQVEIELVYPVARARAKSGKGEPEPRVARLTMSGEEFRRLSGFFAAADSAGVDQGLLPNEFAETPTDQKRFAPKKRAPRGSKTAANGAAKPAKAAAAGAAA